jgi:hypothetical protein
VASSGCQSRRRSSHPVMDTLLSLLFDDSGDDLLEYALLSALVGIAGAVGLALMPGVINQVYTSWDTATQNIWTPADPIP